ncbi:MAG: molybdenum cofactor guanylyltransferase [Chloroflexi bacterium]|nr:molybdenum cofactor guanylyltransferase [Chloroflexota bacterium]
MEAIVLAGGQSKRIGLPKAFLPLGSTTLVQTVVAGLRSVFPRVMVVVREKRGWGDLEAEPGVEVLEDQRPQRGPLVGLARGLAASRSPWCFVAACDMPFLQRQVILRMTKHLDGCDILLAQVGGHTQPLHAFYSKGCLPHVEALLSQDVTSLLALLPRCRVRTMAAKDFWDLDPDLLSFRDIDTIEDYQAAQRLLKASLQREVAK